MAATSAEMRIERSAYVFLSRTRRPVEERLRRDDDPRNAVPALRRLLVEERLLERMEVVRRADPLERRDRAFGEGCGGCDARRYRLAVHDHRARVALLEAAAELRRGQPQLIS